MYYIQGFLLILIAIFAWTFRSTVETSMPLFWGFALEGYPVEEKALEQLHEQTHIAPQLICFYLQWPKSRATDIDNGSINKTLESIWRIGAVPCLTWEPMYLEDGQFHAVLVEDLLNGHYDPYLNSMAEDIKAWNGVMIMRFAHEMNTVKYHWGTTQEDYGSKSPEIYKKMFKYLFDRFRALNVTNVLWAFCPNADSVPYADKRAKWNVISSYYPGDEYVDILGMDGYNWGDLPRIQNNPNWTDWRSFKEVFKSIYAQLRKLSTTKPIIVFETAMTATSDKRSIWIQEALAVAREWKLQGMIWFQVDKEKNWILADQEALAQIRMQTSFSQAWARVFMKENN